MVKDLITNQKPKHIFIAADLSDPNGTHRVVYRAIKMAMEQLGEQVKDVTCWLYRGAWQEWEEGCEGRGGENSEGRAAGGAADQCHRPT